MATQWNFLFAQNLWRHKAYLIGFIAAYAAIDQNKNTNTKTLTITIHAKDIAVLELLKLELIILLLEKDFFGWIVWEGLIKFLL